MEIQIMAHYAELDENNIVLQVIVVRNQDCLDENGQETEDAARAFLKANGHLGRYIKTSYNTRENIHYGDDGSPDGKPPFRGNYAGRGFIYDPTNDVFYEPQPYPSWILDQTKWNWVAPVVKPDIERNQICEWDENTKAWIIKTWDKTTKTFI